MAEPLSEGLTKLEQAVFGSPSFDPRQASFELELHAPDLATPALLELRRALVKEAPRISLSIQNVSADLSARLGERVRSLALVPSHFLDEGLRRRPVGEAHFEIVGRVDHPLFLGAITRKRWLDYPQVVVMTRNERANAIDEALWKQGVERTIGLQVPSFLAGLLALVKSDLLMNAPVPLGTEAFRALGLRAVRPPFALPRVRLALGWHERFQNDPAHRWVRELAFSIFRSRFEEMRPAISRGSSSSPRTSGSSGARSKTKVPRRGR